jgi:phosphoglycolate phosphatase
MRYRLALFDFDGTLADSFSWFLGVVNRLADENRFRRIEEHEVDALRGQSARKLVGHFGIPTWKLPVIANQMRQHMARDISHISLFPGVDRMLQGLASRGIQLGIVTSNSVENVRQVLGPENADLIQHYACGISMFGKRPKLRAILRASGVSAAEAICIGDEIRDLEAAHAEGILFGAVSWGYTHPEALQTHGPEEMFASLEEILEKVGQRKGATPAEPPREAV